MATVMYPKGREGFATGAVNWTGDNIKLFACDTNDHPYSSANDFLDDITVGAIVATSGNLSGKTATDGTLDAADLVLTAVTGDTFEALIFYKDTTVGSTSRLLFFVDNYGGLPFTPNTGDINVQFPNDSNKICTI